MNLSIVVPCHNEEKNIPLILKRFLDAYRKHPFELILVNNASTDNSKKIFNSLLSEKKYKFARIIDEPIPGYGRAIIAGLKSAKGDVLAWTHADMQTDPMDVIAGFELFKSEFNNDKKIIIKGKRIKRPFGARMFTFGMSLITSVVLHDLYFDINAQPKIFSREFFEKNMACPPHDFSLDLYLLACARKNKYRLIAFPVFFNKRMHGKSKWAFSFKSKWKTILRTVKYIFALKKKLSEMS